MDPTELDGYRQSTVTFTEARRSHLRTSFPPELKFKFTGTSPVTGRYASARPRNLGPKPRAPVPGPAESGPDSESPLKFPIQAESGIGGNPTLSVAPTAAGPAKPVASYYNSRSGFSEGRRWPRAFYFGLGVRSRAWPRVMPVASRSSLTGPRRVHCGAAVQAPSRTSALRVRAACLGGLADC